MRRFSVRFRAWLVALALVDAQLGGACAMLLACRLPLAWVLVRLALRCLCCDAIRLACSYAARLGSSAACSGFCAACTCALVDAQLVSPFLRCFADLVGCDMQLSGLHSWCSDC